MHIQERGAERCLTSCMLCFRSFLNSNFCGPGRAQPGSVQPGNPNVMRELSFALPHRGNKAGPVPGMLHGHTPARLPKCQQSFAA